MVCMLYRRTYLRTFPYWGIMFRSGEYTGLIGFSISEATNLQHMAIYCLFMLHVLLLLTVAQYACSAVYMYVLTDKEWFLVPRHSNRWEKITDTQWCKGSLLCYVVYLTILQQRLYFKQQCLCLLWRCLWRHLCIIVMPQDSSIPQSIMVARAALITLWRCWTSTGVIDRSIIR